VHHFDSVLAADIRHAFAYHIAVASGSGLDIGYSTLLWFPDA
jgi:hypothetical protein